MKTLHKIAGTAALGAALMTGIVTTGAQPAFAQSGGRSETKIQTRLTGGAINGIVPSGSSRFRNRGSSSNFSVELEDVAHTDGTVLSVTLLRGGASIPAGTIRLALRAGEIDVNTNDGNAVPQAQAGDVAVVSSASGDALLSGVLR